MARTSGASLGVRRAACWSRRPAGAERLQVDLGSARVQRRVSAPDLQAARGGDLSVVNQLGRRRADPTRQPGIRPTRPTLAARDSTGHRAGPSSGIRVSLLLSGAPGWANGGRSSRSGPPTIPATSPTLPPPPRGATPASPLDDLGRALQAGRFQPLAEPSAAASAPPAPWPPPVRAHPRRLLRRAEERGSGRPGDRREHLDCRRGCAAQLHPGDALCRTGAGRAWISTATTRSGRGSRIFAKTRSATAPPTSLTWTRWPAGSTGYGYRDARGRRLKLFLSEFISRPTTRTIEFNFCVTQGIQARWLGAALRIARRWERIYTLGYLGLYDDPPRPDGLEVNRGLLRRSGKKKLAYSVFRRG